MKIKPAAIEIGKCYSTRHGELRQVVSLEPRGEVTFDSRKPTEADGRAPARRFHASLEAFAREVVAEASWPS